MSVILERAQVAAWCEAQRQANRKLVFTNGCFDILHAGHVRLLEAARGHGDALLVGLNSDASVQRLKGASRPVHPQNARAEVLAALRAVSAVAVFDEDTPLELLKLVRPDIHVKGDDYHADALPETPLVRAFGGEVVIVPLLQGFSSSQAIAKLSVPQSSIVIVPARFGSTRFPGKPLAQLGGQTVIERVVRQVLQAKVSRPVLIATDDARISNAIGAVFDFREVEAVMTSAECRTGTDRLAEVVRARVPPQELKQTLIINVQGDEPFVSPSHLDALLELMQDASLRMGTLAVALDEAHATNPTIVKVVCDDNQRALYFSRSPIPFLRDDSQPRRAPLLRHLGLYAYRADWLLQLAGMPSSLLEDDEKLEQLRALESGEPIGVAVVASGPDIAIDTPDDLERAREFLARSS